MTNSDDNLFQTSTQTSGGSLASKLPISLIIVAGIVLLTAVLIMTLFVFKPQAKKQSIPELIVKVNTVQASKQDYPIQVNTNGTVQAKTRGNLVAQVSGDVIAIGSAFTAGGVFSEGELLLQIDDRNYRSEVSRSQASLSQAQAALQQEKANAKQAALDWQRLGNAEQAPDLVLRKPQLAAAQAQMESAKAALERAQLDLERTKIRAPYAGQLIRDNVALGQYVSIGTPVAEIFKTDEVEVHLPISQSEYMQLGFDQTNFNEQPKYVELTSDFAGNAYNWRARITGTDGIFDQTTRQTNVIAKIAAVENAQSDKPKLKLGQFVDAKIEGQTIRNIIVVPNESVREGNTVFLAKDGRLAREQIDILWQDGKSTLIRGGIIEGDEVVTTALSSTVSGAKVEIAAPITQKPKPETQASTQGMAEEGSNKADSAKPEAAN